MNANEVIANRANELRGLARRPRIHPNDHVNREPVVERRHPDGAPRRGARGVRAELLPALARLCSDALGREGRALRRRASRSGAPI